MKYLVDTVALVRHFTERGEIGRKALDVLNAIDSSNLMIAVSIVSLMEVMYLAEKNRIQISLGDTLRMMELSSNYTVVDLNSDILKVAENIQFHELHDRLILATAKWLEIPVISSDRAFGLVEDITVVWD